MSEVVLFHETLVVGLSMLRAGCFFVELQRRPSASAQRLGRLISHGSRFSWSALTEKLQSFKYHWGFKNYQDCEAIS